MQLSSGEAKLEKILQDSEAMDGGRTTKTWGRIQTRTAQEPSTEKIYIYNVPEQMQQKQESIQGGNSPELKEQLIYFEKVGFEIRTGKINFKRNQFLDIFPSKVLTSRKISYWYSGRGDATWQRCSLAFCLCKRRQLWVWSLNSACLQLQTTIAS